MNLGEVLGKMRNSDMLYVGMGMYKLYGGLVHQGKEELQKYMDREVEKLSPSISRGLVIELERGSI